MSTIWERMSRERVQRGKKMSSKRKMRKGVFFLLLALLGYIAFEGYSLYSATGVVPEINSLFDSARERGQAIKTWIGNLEETEPGSIDYSVSVYKIRDNESHFSFQFRFEATERFQSQNLPEDEFIASKRPMLAVPNACRMLGGGWGRNRGRLWWTYDVICEGSLYSKLASYVESEAGRIKRDRAKLPFTVLDMSVAHKTFMGLPIEGVGLGMNVKPNRQTEADDPYKITVYDDWDKPRGERIVTWTRPELNAKTQKFVGPFNLSRNEIDAYSPDGGLGKDLDLRPFFSVLLDGEPFDIYDNPKIKEWIERNVSIKSEPAPELPEPVQVVEPPVVPVDPPPNENKGGPAPVSREATGLVPAAITVSAPSSPALTTEPHSEPLTQQLTVTQSNVASEQVTLPCGLAPDGIVVTAWVDEEEVSRGIVVDGSYAIRVNQLDRQFDGEVVSFRVGTVAASQSARWTQGAADELNLTATSTRGISVVPGDSNLAKEEGPGPPIPPHFFVGTVNLRCADEDTDTPSPSPSDASVPSNTELATQNPNSKIECAIRVQVSEAGATEKSFRYDFTVVNKSSAGVPSFTWSIFPPKKGNLPNEFFHSKPNSGWTFLKLPLSGPPYLEYRFSTESDPIQPNGGSMPFAVGTHSPPDSGGSLAMEFAGGNDCVITDIQVPGLTK